jgi:hypothetical protein
VSQERKEGRVTKEEKEERKKEYERDRDTHDRKTRRKLIKG